MEWTDCPSEQQLHDFAMGRMPDALIERIGSHAEECESCSARLDAVESSAQSLQQIFAEEAESESSAQLFDGLVKQVLQTREAAEAPSHCDEQAADTVDRDSGKTADHPSDELEPGELFGSYRIVEHLGEGAFGNVYRAHHQALKRDVVIKYLKPHLLDLPEVRKRFEREMEAIGKLDHPNLVKATDAGEVDGIPYIAMEFHPGQTVNHILRRQAFVEELMACDIIRQAALGLDHAHRKGLIHRDIKPSNVLVGDDGCVKVLDLGLALFTPHRAEVASDRRSGLLESRGKESLRVTRAGTAVGTKAYMAPEQWADSHQVDLRADIYSLGCLFHMLLTGEHAGQSEAMKMPLAHQSRRIRRLPESHPLRPILARMLALNPTNRYESAADVAKEMEQYLEQARDSAADDDSSSGSGGDQAVETAAGDSQPADQEAPYRIATPRFAKARPREDGTPLGAMERPLGKDEATAGQAENEGSPPTSNRARSNRTRSKWLLPVLLIGGLLLTSVATSAMLWWWLARPGTSDPSAGRLAQATDGASEELNVQGEGSSDDLPGDSSTDDPSEGDSTGTPTADAGGEPSNLEQEVDPSVAANSERDSGDQASASEVGNPGEVDEGPADASDSDSNHVSTDGNPADSGQTRPRPTQTSPGILRFGISDSLRIEGTNELVNGSEPVTIEFWFRSHAVGLFEQTLLTTAKSTRGVPRHFRKRDIGWRLVARELGPHTRLELFDPASDLSGTSGHMIPAVTAFCDSWGGGWHHLAVMRDKDKFTVMIDGNVKLRHVRPFSDFATEEGVESFDLHVGGSGGIGPPQGLEADIRGIRISEGMRYEPSGFEPPLLFEKDETTACLLDFTTDSAEELGDLTGNGFKGILRGATWLHR